MNKDKLSQQMLSDYWRRIAVPREVLQKNGQTHFQKHVGPMPRYGHLHNVRLPSITFDQEYHL